ncbi:TonB-dependent receptor [Stenotrophomonas sp. MMGLT7]|uniref:TonB-dependent receptor plug domain-containing protein n=1 Tax=Stenotrophomonas sp. MMGLT7 TaxID=2901227 RepID=UPI001E2E7C59|nr:TonB-dependent receptor [Stenotrophomonas sp. MMGLT7]MCD7098477.1 TonB-dependent receptor [Stenotrophomonas sp. MMGLT7]
MINNSLLAAAIAAALVLPAHAQEAATAAGSSKTLDTVIVTGTSTGERTVTSSLQPIDVISSEQLQNLGTTEFAAALARLVPAISFPQPVTISGAEVVRPVTLRGLSPDQVLVLVNGKRRHNGAFLNMGGAVGRGSNPVDLNAIPISAIARIEVLRDGASARYGSDAIGGVINVILKQGDEGGNVGFKYGGYSEGDGLRRQLSGDAGFRLGENGGIHVSAEFENNDYTNRSGPYYGSGAIGSAAYGTVASRRGDPDVRSNKAALSGHYAFSDAAELYVDALYRRGRYDTALVFRAANASNNIKDIYPDGYLPMGIPIVRDSSVVAGLRGAIGNGWYYDLSLNHGQNEYDQRYDMVNADYYNAYGWTPFRIQGSNFKNTQDVADLDLSRDFDVAGLHGPLTVAFGVQYLRQQYRIGQGDIYSLYGSGGSLTGPTPGKWRRHNLAQYVNLEADISERFSSSLALRREDYSDFGATTSGALSGRFDFTPRVALRGTVSTGFRAPTLVQQYYSNITSQYQDLGNGTVLVETGTFPATSRIASLLGAEPLKAEKSRSATLGLVLNPLDGWNLSLDAFYIRIDDRINVSSNLNIGSEAAQAYLAEQGITANYSSLSYFSNAVDTRTRGVELVSQYGFDLASGHRLDTSLSWSYNDNEVVKVKANPAILEQLGVNTQRVERRERLGLLADTNPRTKLNLGADYDTRRHWSFHGTVNRYGWYKTYSNTSAALDEWFGPKWTLDLSARYALGSWDFAAGADNVLDTRPGRVNDTTDTGALYSLFSPMSWNGRYVYASVNYRW